MANLSTKRIKAVLFDAAGTLFDTRTTVGALYHGLAICYGSKATAEAINSSYLNYLRTYGTPKDRHSWESMVRIVFDEVGEVSDFDTFFEELYKLFQTHHGWSCFPETHQVLKSLRKAGYLIGIVSNFDDRLYDLLVNLQLIHLVDSVTIPSSCGYAKPNQGIFDAATTSLGIVSDEAIFIGDNPVEDFQAATRAGLKAMLILRGGEASKGEIPSISNLSEILNVLNIPTTSV